MGIDCIGRNLLFRRRKGGCHPTRFPVLVDIVAIVKALRAMSVDLLAETPVYKLWCIDTRRESRKWLSSTFRLAQRLGTSTPRTFAVLSSSFLWWQPKMEVEVGVVAHGRRKSCIPRAFAPLLVQILRTGRSSKKRINRPHMATKKAHHVRKCVPRYIIDLDLPPEERWNQVVDDYKGTRGAITVWKFLPPDF